MSQNALKKSLATGEDAANDNSNTHTVRTDYAILLAQGPDTIKESFDIVFKPHVWEKLERLKEKAQEVDPRGGGLVYFEIEGWSFQMQSHGRRGGSFCFFNDDVEFQLRSKDIGWAVTVEYRSGGLWEHSAEVLRERVQSIVKALGEPRNADWIRLSEIHWAFDFYSPEFSDEISAALRDKFVCISKVKNDEVGKVPVFPAHMMKDEYWAAHGSGGRTETVQVGSKSSLQVQIYDKGREIRENSKKFWMKELYQHNQMQPGAEGLVIDDLEHIWRVELRFKGKGYLKKRNIQTYEHFMAEKDAILQEALTTRRLAQPTNDTNRSRWPNHHLWDACYMATKVEYEYVRKEYFVVGHKEELQENLTRNIAGSLRSLVVLKLDGDFDDHTLEKTLAEAVEVLKADLEHEKKINKAAERYRYIHDAG